MAWTDLINGSLKQFYPDSKVKAPNIRVDPLAKIIPFRGSSGKTIRSTNFSTNQNMFYAGDMGKLKTAINSNYLTNFSPLTGFDWTVGNIFSGFLIDKKQISAARTVKGGMIEAIKEAVALAFGSWKTLFGISLYGSGYGELGVVKSATAYTAATSFSLTVSKETVFNVRIGQTLRLTSGLYPSLGFMAGTFLCTGKSVDPAAGTANNKLFTGTLTLTPTNSGTTVLNSYVCLYGCQDASNNPLLPVGLAGILPSYGQRGEDGSGTYATFLSIPFMGVTRSSIGNAGTYKISSVSGCYANTSEIAANGNIVANDPLSAVELCLNRINALGGGYEDGLKIVMNPLTLEYVREISITNRESALNLLSIAKKTHSYGSKAWNPTSWEDMVITSNHCPISKIYIVNTNDIEFRFQGADEEAEKDPLYYIFDEEKQVAGDQDKPMKDNTTQINEKAPASDYPLVESNFDFNSIKMLTLSPGSASVDGEGLSGTLTGYGAFVHWAPGWSGVVDVAALL